MHMVSYGLEFVYTLLFCVSIFIKGNNAAQDAARTINRMNKHYILSVKKGKKFEVHSLCKKFFY